MNGSILGIDINGMLAMYAGLAFLFVVGLLFTIWGFKRQDPNYDDNFIEFCKTLMVAIGGACWLVILWILAGRPPLRRKPPDQP